VQGLHQADGAGQEAEEAEVVVSCPHNFTEWREQCDPCQLQEHCPILMNGVDGEPEFELPILISSAYTADPRKEWFITDHGPDGEVRICTGPSSTDETSDERRMICMPRRAFWQCVGQLADAMLAADDG